MSEEEVKQVILESVKSKNLGVSWSVGNKLVVFQKAAKTESSSGTKSSESNSDINLVEWEKSLYSPIGRKLINESCETFLNLQNLAKTICQKVITTLLWAT